jgi:D-alanyl-lipoteichoic acid acyltransferase DltB (MBOAT superfamily)
LADNIAPAVNLGFSSDPSKLSAIDVSTLAFLFGFQIYFDFSAYSHIALGSALLMGIKFPENFNFPYFASSPRDFWRRWHITLSSWIRDYLYLPLMKQTGGQVSTGGIMPKFEATTARAFFVLFVTWAIMGLWHGASWTFVFWGLWHAMLVYGHRALMLMPWQNDLPRPWVLTGTAISIFLIMLGWIPFRAEDMVTVVEMFRAFLDPSRWLFLGLPRNTYLLAAFTACLIVVGPGVWRGLHKLRLQGSLWGNCALWFIAWLLTAATLIYLRPLEQFIYFQF